MYGSLLIEKILFMNQIQYYYLRYVYTAFVIIFCVSAFYVHDTYAQGEVSVKIQPSSIDEALDPGGIFDGVLTVTNENGGKQTLYLNTRDIEGMKETGAPIFSQNVVTDSQYASSWIEPLLKSVTLEVGESTKIPFRITVPQDASPGSHYAALFVSREAETQATSGAGVGFHVASLIHLRISGEVVDDLMFREFSTDQTFYTKPEVNFTVKLENTGTVQQRPKGFVTVTDMLGNEVGKVEVNETAGAIMHRTFRTFENVWKHEGFTLGRYTASASIGYGEPGAQKTITRSTSFWVIPVQELGIAFGAVVAIVLILVSVLRAYIRRELSRAGHTVRKVPSQVTFAKRLIRNMVWLIALLGIALIGMVVFFG
jgi:hypothetical protein